MRSVAPLLFVLFGSAFAAAPKTVNPCPAIAKECEDLECPGGSELVEYPGHCCPYCKSTVKIIDYTDYSGSAKDAFQAYGTAPYGGGYKPQPPWEALAPALIKKSASPAPAFRGA